MYSILEESIGQIEISRSVFIAIARHIESKDEIKDVLIDIKKKCPKAKHYCYATIIGNYQKSSDDGEPKGTAGKPILDVLKKCELDKVIVVVVRYFGGVLLGASRLLRAYVESSNLTLEKATKYKIVEGFRYSLEVEYALFDELKNYLISNDVIIEESRFEEKIYLTIFTKEDNIKDLDNVFNKKIIYQLLAHTYKYMKEA